jgi:hypothetical protein
MSLLTTAWMCDLCTNTQMSLDVRALAADLAPAFDLTLGPCASAGQP